MRGPDFNRGIGRFFYEHQLLGCSQEYHDCIAVQTYCRLSQHYYISGPEDLLAEREENASKRSRTVPGAISLIVQQAEGEGQGKVYTQPIIEGAYSFIDE